MYILITGSRWKSHVALALFIYLYLNEDTESLIKVVIVANSAGRGVGCQTGGRVCRRLRREGVARGHRPAQTDPHSDRHTTKEDQGLHGPLLPWGWVGLVAGDQAVRTALAERGRAGAENPGIRSVSRPEPGLCLLDG